MTFGTRVLNGQPAITSTASAPPTPIATMPSPPAFGVWLSVPIIIPPGNAYCSSTTWWMIPEPGFQKPMPYFALDRAQELVDLGVRVERGLEVDVGADAGLDQVVAVHRGRHRDGRQLGQRELQQRHLRGRVLHRDAVRAVVAVVDAPLEPDRRRVVGVGEHAPSRRRSAAGRAARG